MESVDVNWTSGWAIAVYVAGGGTVLVKAWTSWVYPGLRGAWHAGQALLAVGRELVERVRRLDELTSKELKANGGSSAIDKLNALVEASDTHSEVLAQHTEQLAAGIQQFQAIEDRAAGLARRLEEVERDRTTWHRKVQRELQEIRQVVSPPAIEQGPGRVTPPSVTPPGPGEEK